MRISLGLVLLLTAGFAFSGVEGVTACARALVIMLRNTEKASASIECKSDPKGSAALTALAGDPVCKNYKFTVGDQKCEILAVPYMKCVAGKLGILNDDGSINNTKILAKFKSYATSKPGCDAPEYDFGAKKCGTQINNYAFLKKAACIASFASKYTG
ncbi:uncharacterized protein LOC108668588 [Hyalella azteca]|uniref:Uncharacterized protein LOC108668588 n=1 Tax=Hyalella azteca TaxID=294128 RepID=A0A8B7NCJ4_HYAAZ|nr:uncharacterized protein LOC108668588 [Hyalella azteca]